MRQRPVACLALLIFLILRLLPDRVFYKPCQVEKSCEVQVTGCVDWQIQKDGKTQIYLKTCQVWNEEISFEEEKLLVYLAEPAVYTAGTDLSLSGIIYPIEEPTNPGQFHSKLYYQGKGITCTMYATHTKILGEHPAPIRQCLLDLRTQISEVLASVLPEQYSEILRAMILGEKESLDTEIKEFYQNSGISHLLSISGLHISMIGVTLYRILRRITGSYALSGIPASLFLCAYGWMTGASVSAVRAIVMCMITILADLVGRTYDMLTAVGVAALVLMLTNPLCVCQSGFLLSFGAVTGIALLQPIWTLYCKNMSSRLQSLSVSLSVLTITFPMLLRFFYEYPLYSAFLNLLAIPLMSVLMACGILCGLTGLVSIPAARILGIPCCLILKIYEKTGKVSMSLPGSLLATGSPSMWKVVCYYTVLAAALLILYREKKRKKYWRKKSPFIPDKKRLLICLGMLMLSASVLCVRVYTGVQITMLDVGQGDAVFFRSPSGTTFLYDGGSSNEKKVGEYRLLPFLQSEGIRTLDYMMISHMDQDHISGLTELILSSKETGSVRIGHAVLPKLTEKDEAYQEMERLLEEAQIPIIYMSTGDRLEEGEFSLNCLYPQADAYSDDRNDLAMVLLMDYQEFQMLLTGDIGAETENKLVSTGLLQDVEVLKVAHHGSRYSTSGEFLKAVCPEVSLISCSATNRYGHPGAETLQRLEDVDSQIYITKDCGAIQVWTNGKSVQVKNYKDSN
ncbi:MAG: DNA internalization-related competence protein ComEC/Rec2 [Lachnospiraceae bacterium]|nr:DNA internalization-related competence protein ComEC/Rec2 [Lachnospiraceae bacterium]